MRIISLRSMLFGLLAILGAAGVFPARALEETLRLPLGESAEYPLPNGAEARFLVFSARIDAPNFKSGAQPALRLLVNGMPVDGSRLANKGDYFHFRSDHAMAWVDNGSEIVLGYYPWDGADKTADKEFIFDFAFDLEGLLRPDGNTLRLVNVFKAFKDSALEFRGLRVLAHPDFPRSPTISEKKPQSFGLADLRRRAVSLHAGADKQLEVKDDYDAWTPRAQWAPSPPAAEIPVAWRRDADNNLCLEGPDGLSTTLRSTWRVGAEIAVPDGDDRWASTRLSVEREVEKTPFGLVLRDTLRNLTDAPLPVIVDLAFHVDLARLRVFRANGLPQAAFALNTDNLTHRRFSQTPLYFFAFDRGGLGIYMEDDCFRNQHSAIAVDDALHLANDLFYLAPGASYTTVVRLYPVDDGDYYTTLNRLRADYGLYQPIPGLFGFVYPFKESLRYERYYRKTLDTPEKLRAFFAESGITMPCVTPIASSDRGDGMLYGNEPDRAYDASLDVPEALLKDMRSAGLELPLLLYTDVHIVRADGRADLGGESQWETRLADSVLRDNFDRAVPYASGRLYHVAPRPDNASGRQLARNLAHALDERGFSGLFLDEWNHSRARAAFNRSDGVTALLTPEGGIARPIALVPLYSKPFLLEFGRQATIGGRIAFANQFDCLKELMDLPIIHFAEPVAHDGGNYLIYAAQAGRTPLTLTCKRGTTAWEDVKYFLRFGLVCCFYATRMYGDHALQRLYPITVREIYPGVVFGDDRIFTRRPGRYTLNRDKTLAAYVYSDPDGLLARTLKGEGSIELALDEDREVALIVEEQ